MTTLVLDTQTFLHYRAISEIVWSEFFDSKDIVLLVPLKVLEELQHIKDRGQVRRGIRGRAAKALKQLDHYFGIESGIREGVSICFESERPETQIDFEQLGLGTSADEVIIATAIASSQHAETHLVTADLGMKVRAKALGVSVVTIPEAYHLPDSLTAEEKELERLKRELAEFESRSPEWLVEGTTELLLDDGETPTCSNPVLLEPLRNFEAAIVKPPSSVETNRVENIQNRFSFQALTNRTSNPHYREQVEDYRAFLNAIEGDLERWRRLAQKVFPLNLILKNQGSARATNVRVGLQLNKPQDLHVVTAADFVGRPPELFPPSRESSLGLTVVPGVGRIGPSPWPQRREAFEKWLEKVRDFADEPFSSEFACEKFDTIAHHDLELLKTCYLYLPDREDVGMTIVA